jgi:hypothetical protein
MYSIQNLPANSGRYPVKNKASLRIPEGFRSNTKPPCEFRKVSDRIQSLPANSWRFPIEYKAFLRILEGFRSNTKPSCKFRSVLYSIERLPASFLKPCIRYDGPPTWRRGFTPSNVLPELFPVAVQPLGRGRAGAGMELHGCDIALRIPEGFTTVGRSPCEFWKVLQRL